MPFETHIIFLIVLAGIIGLLIAYFQYYFKEKKNATYKKYVFLLRSLGIFCLLLALINPSISVTNYEIEKPNLNILVDNSKSIVKLKEESTLKNVIKKFEDNTELKEKFDVKWFQFSEKLQTLSMLNFTGNQTNITNALRSLQELSTNRNERVVLITDGNQTMGYDYKNYQYPHPVFPFALGDTASYKDVSIVQLNVNKYSYVGNDFPVELFVNSKSDSNEELEVTVSKNNKVLRRKNFVVAPNTSKKLAFTLSSLKKGLHRYTIQVLPIKNERNTLNNNTSFTIEVLDQKSEVLIISNIAHPDIGVLKRSIESNAQKKVTIRKTENLKDSLQNYKAIIAYQPDITFTQLFSDLDRLNRNLFIITGEQTDYSFLNSQNLGFKKQFINDVEKASPVYNSGFLPFQQEDIGFFQFPPLTDVFGQITFYNNRSDLLNQRINGIATDNPLLSSTTAQGRKIMVLFGEGIWQWRSTSFLRENRFQSFDTFLNKIVQFISNTEQRDQLEVEVNSSFSANERINFSAYFYDKNFEFDQSAILELSLKNKDTNRSSIYPFFKENNIYRALVENLSPGIYEYRVEEKRTKQFRTGSIVISDSEIENQFINANLTDLNLLAAKNKGRVYFKDNLDSLIENLVRDPGIGSIQKSVKTNTSLLTWWQYMVLICLLFSAEWILRKYHGLI